MSRTTSIDVALRAGVSQSAVSRTFTKGASVSPKTSRLVLKAANELNYRPNAIARSLITGKSKIIALVVAYLDNQFYSSAVQVLSKALKQEDYHILIFLTPNATDKEAQKVVNELIDYQVDCIIAASVAVSNSLVGRCKSLNLPIILFNRHQNNSSISSVTSNNFLGAKQATQYLIDLGHKRIAHITGWQGSSTGLDRARGFELTMKRNGLVPAGVIDGMYKREVAMQATRHLFTEFSPPPDAIFVGNDHMAFAVMDVIREELRLKIPEDVSVIGYDNVPLADWGSYNLSTISQPLNEMVNATVKQMIKLVDNPTASPVQVKINGNLIVRKSTRKRKINV